MRPTKVVKAIMIVFLLSPLTAMAAQSLTPYKAEYKVKIMVLSGKLITEVRQTENGFMAHSVVQPSGLARLFLGGNIEESAWFGTSDGGVIPDRYSSVDTLTSDKKVMDFQFDWDRNEVTGTINDEEHRIELDGLVHDRVSIQYELMLDLLNNEPDQNYTLLNKDELRPIMVTNIGKKTLKVPFGKFEAVGIQHSTADSSRLTTLWCVEELGYLPVMIEQFRDGKLRVRARLKHYAPIARTVETAAN